MHKLALFPRTTQIEATPTGERRSVEAHERLTIAGCDLADLADRYGTPLYV